MKDPIRAFLTQCYVGIRNRFFRNKSINDKVLVKIFNVLAKKYPDIGFVLGIFDINSDIDDAIDFGSNADNYSVIKVLKQIAIRLETNSFNTQTVEILSKEIIPLLKNKNYCIIMFDINNVVINQYISNVDNAIMTKLIKGSIDILENNK